MGDYSLQDLVNAAGKAGFQGPSLAIAVAVSLAEDGRMSLTAVNVNNDPWKSRDRGPWQINDHWHPDVPDSCAFDLQCSANAAFKISNSGASWTPWATFQNGAYKKFLGQASGLVPQAISSATAALPDLGAVFQGITSSVLAAGQVLGGGILIITGLVIAVLLARRNG